jgi:hypothetical protein
MLIDRLAPEPDGTRIEHLVVDGEPDHVYPCVMEADFLRAVSENAAVKLLFAIRSSAERGVAAIRGRDFSEPPEPDALRLSDMTEEGEWVLLGQDPPREVAFGTIGRFWSGETEWEEIRAAEFASFERPGYAKIACNFSLRPYGTARTIVTYEARTKATDSSARRGFLRYWRVVSPFVGMVMRSQLRVIARDAKAAGWQGS